jgi:hypothetical protein
VRILHVDSGRQMRGGQRQVLLLMKGLRDAGHESTLLAWRGGPLWSAAQTAGFPVFSATLFDVVSHARKHALVHAHDAHSHTLAAVAAGPPLVVSRRVAFPVGRSLLSRWKYRRATRYLAVSRFVAVQLEAAGVPAEKIEVVFDAVESIASTPAWRAGGPVVSLASSDPRKGRDLAEAAGRLAPFEITYSNDLERDLPGASVFLYLTRSEGFGSAALLAMSLGVPVIASRVEGLCEALAFGQAGILVENDPSQIAAAVVSLRADPARARSLASAARLHLEQSFTLQTLVEGTLAAYRRVLAA